jgi:6-phosphogluconolactonase (cycloisomerase 2 family)
MSYRILTASYSNEIVTLNFDPESRKLSTVASLTVGHHPSWITPHISDPSIYFTALEQENGAIIVLKYDSDGIVRVVREISSLGADPCTVVMSRTKGDLLVGNVSFRFLRLSDSIAC